LNQEVLPSSDPTKPLEAFPLEFDVPVQPTQETLFNRLGRGFTSSSPTISNSPVLARRSVVRPSPPTEKHDEMGPPPLMLSKRIDERRDSGSSTPRDLSAPTPWNQNDRRRHSTIEVLSGKGIDLKDMGMSLESELSVSHGIDLDLVSQCTHSDTAVFNFYSAVSRIHNQTTFEVCV
jgi:hypothetical protein